MRGGGGGGGGWGAGGITIRGMGEFCRYPRQSPQARRQAQILYAVS